MYIFLFESAEKNVHNNPTIICPSLTPFNSNRVQIGGGICTVDAQQALGCVNWKDGKPGQGKQLLWTMKAATSTMCDGGGGSGYGFDGL